jgi:4,5-DOPA dioxygenase extradiol
MYPEAIIPVLQLSIDYTKGPQFHFDLAKEIYGLRKKGILIIGSGNMVHNLKMVDWNMINQREFGYDWALKMDYQFKKLITHGDPRPLINYESLGNAARLAIPTPEHYLPLLYSLGLRETNETVTFFNDKAVGGSITMTSVKIFHF